MKTYIETHEGITINVELPDINPATRRAIKLMFDSLWNRLKADDESKQQRLAEKRKHWIIDQKSRIEIKESLLWDERHTLIKQQKFLDEQSNSTGKSPTTITLKDYTSEHKKIARALHKNDVAFRKLQGWKNWLATHENQQ